MTTAFERATTDWRKDEVASGPILVATDGTDSANAALRAALALADETGADVIAIAVVESLPLVGSDYGIIIPPMEAVGGRRKVLEQRVREQLRELGASTAVWAVEVQEGDPQATIARVARERDARVIVMGLGHHDLLDRLLGSETALHVTRGAHTPVLAVPAEYAASPSRAVIATDFSVASVTAARKAFALFDTIRTAYLVHVAPSLDVQPEAFAAWMSIFGEGIGPAFDRVKAEIGLPPSIEIETVTRQGKPARTLLEFARSVQADLIVTGSRGAGLIDRLLVGSTATGLLRGADCAVLAVPAIAHESRLSWPSKDEPALLERERWSAELDTFTKRNIGRLASLEVDDPELGAQAQERDYPFLGATWDPHDERVELMLGDFKGTRRHLTRGISGVTGIQVLRDHAGRDWILRVAHAPGQTILVLKR